MTDFKAEGFATMSCWYSHTVQHFEGKGGIKFKGRIKKLCGGQTGKINLISLFVDTLLCTSTFHLYILSGKI